MDGPNPLLLLAIAILSVAAIGYWVDDRLESRRRRRRTPETISRIDDHYQDGSFYDNPD